MLGYLTWTLSAAQHSLAARQAELQEQEIEANRDLRLLDIFFKEITSNDPKRKRLAYAIVEVYARPTLIKALGTVAPELAVKSAIDISTNRTLPNQTRGEAERLRYEITNRLEISQPSDGDTVDMIIGIRGGTPFSEMHHHYIVVTPLKTGTDIMEREVSVSEGLFDGEAKLGDAGVGAGERFAIRILVTKALLARGSTPPVLDGAISSNSIIVTRKK